MAERDVHHENKIKDAAELDVVSSDDGRERRGWWSTRLAVVGAVATALIVGTTVINLARELVGDPSWPSACGIDGHPDWCAKPSAAMTDQRLVMLVVAHCPAMSGLKPSEVVPQPLTAIGPGNSKTLARTSGTAGNGSEEALLGQPGRLSWVTRQVGGEDHGQVRVTCLDAARSTPGLQLEVDQFRSTVAAITDEARRIDFVKVAQEIVGTARDPNDTGVSFGFLTCDTRSLQLTRLQVGRMFSCAVQIYGWHGLGAYRVTYRVTDGSPYFARLEQPT